MYRIPILCIPYVSYTYLHINKMNFHSLLFLTTRRFPFQEKIHITTHNLLQSQNIQI